MNLSTITKIQKELATLQKDMKSLAKKHKAAEGDEKLKILDDLKAMTQRRKELDAELESGIEKMHGDAELELTETLTRIILWEIRTEVKRQLSL